METGLPGGTSGQPISVGWRMRWVVIVIVLLIAAACGEGSDATAEAVISPYSGVATCESRFVPHDLDHVTTGGRATTTQFDGTGSGVGVADFDRDGDIDIVLANLSGETTMMWNEGGFEFRRASLVVGRFRQVAPVDVDGDGWTDVVLSTGLGVPVLMRNRNGAFTREPLPGVEAVAYSLAWGDLDGDGDVDLVAGSYNAELTQHRDFSSVLGGKSGVVVLKRAGDAYREERLTDLAQALAVRIHDVDDDGAWDVIAGNDLATPDGVWLQTEDGWEAAEPFAATSFSTMSLDAGDLDNDGDFDLLATDMHPMSDDAETRVAWERVMEDMEAMPVPDTVQQMENVLQVAGSDGFRNAAPALGVAATGWSWAGVFGDFDNDGLLDLYVVNGMEAENLFGHIDGAELVEPNQAFRNIDGTAMEPAPEWGLGDTAGGRGLAMADLDDDGDLDIVVNNLNAPSRVFENRVCGGTSVSVQLEWAGTQNPAGLGSVVRVEADGVTHSRIVDGARGYLSGGPDVVHVGVGDADEVTVSVRWPDGAVSEAVPVPTGNRVVVTRTEGGTDG